MQKDKVKIFVDTILENIEEDERQFLVSMGLEKMLMVNFEKEFSKFPDDIDDIVIKKMAQSIINKIKNKNIYDAFDYNEVDHENLDEYIIKVKDDKKTYSLNELISLCSLKQLKMYNYNYNLMIGSNFNDSEEKDTLISELEKMIISTFKMSIPALTKREIKEYKEAINNNGYVKTINSTFIMMGYHFPVKVGNKKIKYVMPKELLDIFNDYNFDKVSEKTSDYSISLLKTLAIAKGIINESDAYEFLIDDFDLNIKKNDIRKNLNENFAKYNNYYYIKDSMDIPTLDRLIEINKDFSYIPNGDELIDFESIVNQLFNLLNSISKIEFEPIKYLKTLFYEPMDTDRLVKYLVKELKINKNDKKMLDFFLNENMWLFHYWTLGGSPDYDNVEENFMF